MQAKFVNNLKLIKIHKKSQLNFEITIVTANCNRYTHTYIHMYVLVYLSLRLFVVGGNSLCRDSQSVYILLGGVDFLFQRHDNSMREV